MIYAFSISRMNLLCYKYSFAKIVIISFVCIICYSFFITHCSFFVTF